MIKHKASEILETNEQQFITKELKDKILNPDIDLSNYYTKSNSDDKFATKEDLNNIDIPDVDLSNYYKKNETIPKDIGFIENPAALNIPTCSNSEYIYCVYIQSQSRPSDPITYTVIYTKERLYFAAVDNYGIDVQLVQKQGARIPHYFYCLSDGKWVEYKSQDGYSRIPFTLHSRTNYHSHAYGDCPYEIKYCNYSIEYAPIDYYGRSGIVAEFPTFDDNFMPHSFQNKRMSNSNLNNFVGKSGEFIIGTDDSKVTIHDSKTIGGIELAKKSDLDNINIPDVDLSNYYTKEEANQKHDELFQSVSSGKILLETAITDKGGTVSKEGNIPTFEELKVGIEGIITNDPDHVCREEGKQELLETMIQKLPGLQNKLTVDSPLTDFAFYLNMIGQMLFSFKETIKSLPIEALEKIDPVQLNEFNVLMDFIVREEQRTPFTEIFTAFNIPELNIDNSKISLSSTIAEKIEVRDVEYFGHILHFRSNTLYMFEENNNIAATNNSIKVSPKDVSYVLGENISEETEYIIKAYDIDLTQYANLKIIEVID